MRDGDMSIQLQNIFSDGKDFVESKDWRRLTILTSHYLDGSQSSRGGILDTFFLPALD